jgi:hypothetical protein
MKMNTKLLMTASSVILGLASLLALFVPEVVLVTLGAPVTGQLSVIVQLMGALYFAFALMNWTAKDSAIGGIYARPVSLGNFGHFLTGALILVRYQLSREFNVLFLWASVLYAIFAVLFYWLVFHATGIATKK